MRGRLSCPSTSRKARSTSRYAKKLMSPMEPKGTPPPNTHTFAHTIHPPPLPLLKKNSKVSLQMLRDRTQNAEAKVQTKASALTTHVRELIGCYIDSVCYERG